jgi:hypothetical protein
MHDKTRSAAGPFVRRHWLGCVLLLGAAILILVAPHGSAHSQDAGLFGLVTTLNHALFPHAAESDKIPDRPHAIWAAIRFTIKEYNLIPFAKLRRLRVGSIYPHLGRLRVLAGGRTELYDYHNNIIFPDQMGELKKMVARLHAEGFRVVPWISMKRAKPEHSFFLHDDWEPVVQVAQTLAEEVGVDGLQLDPEPLNVRDIPALNQGLERLSTVMRGRELSVAVPKLVPGAPEYDSGYQWGDVKYYRQLTRANALCLMSYDTDITSVPAYKKLLRNNLAVARGLFGEKQVFLGMPSYPLEIVPKGRRRPAHMSHNMPPEDGATFAEAIRDHPDLNYLSGIAIYDLEEPEDRNWSAAFQIAERAMMSLNAVWGQAIPEGSAGAK